MRILKSILVDISNNFTGKVWNTGLMKDGIYYTIDTTPVFEKAMTLGEVVQRLRVLCRKHDEEAYQGVYSKVCDSGRR